MDSDLECSYQTFEELYKEEIRLFNETDRQANLIESNLCTSSEALKRSLRISFYSWMN